MEIFLVLFLLALSDKDPRFKETLKSVLSFYRENRELLVALSGQGADRPRPDAPGTSAEASPAPSPERNSSENLSSEDGVRIIEAFLKSKKF